MGRTASATQELDILTFFGASTLLLAFRERRHRESHGRRREGLISEIIREGRTYRMGVDLTGGHQDMDYEEHVRTYKGFVRGAQVLIVLVAIILIGMAIFLV